MKIESIENLNDNRLMLKSVRVSTSKRLLLFDLGGGVTILTVQRYRSTGEGTKYDDHLGHLFA